MDAVGDFSFDRVAASLHNAVMEELHPGTSTNISSPTPAKPFTAMNATERKEYWSNEEKLSEFFNRVMQMMDGAICAVCENGANPKDKNDKRCTTCGIFYHAGCIDLTELPDICLSCQSVDENPQCFMCSHPNGISPLVRAYCHSKPTVQFCHALCGYWNPRCEKSYVLKDTINCTRIKQARRPHVLEYHKNPCALCGLYSGAKVKCECDSNDCVRHLDTKAFYHVTCARQAGMQVELTIGSGGDRYVLKCFKHVDSKFVLRALLENLQLVELDRSPGGKLFEPNSPITWNHASHLLHCAISIMRTLGWAWRWAEWWVKLGDNWEPLIDDDQAEADMSDDELKLVRSTIESRCMDAERCRLADFGAALRNRSYDKEDGVDQESLERALREVLGTKSLVGPLKEDEIDFFVTWLILAYCSKSPALGFGVDQTPVAKGGAPESRLLPGNREPQKGAPSELQARKRKTPDEEDGCEAGATPAVTVGHEGGGNGAKEQNSHVSIWYSLYRFEKWKHKYIAAYGQDQYDSELIGLLDRLFAEAEHCDNAFINRALDLMERHRSTYIAKRGQSIYLANMAKILNTLSEDNCYYGKIAVYVDKLLEAHCDDTIFIQFSLLQDLEKAYVAAKGRDYYNDKVAVVVDRLLAGDIEHDNDEVVDDKFNLLDRHEKSFVAARGQVTCDTNYADFMRRVVRG